MTKSFLYRWLRIHPTLLREDDDEGFLMCVALEIFDRLLTLPVVRAGQ